MTALNNSFTDSPAPAASVLSSFKGNLPDPTAPTPRAFVNTPVTKEQLIESLMRHQAADAFRPHRYWTANGGCAVGCTIHDFASGRESDHRAYQELFGIPGELARIEDFIFENIKPPRQRTWPIEFIEAVPIGATLSTAPQRCTLTILKDPRSTMAPPTPPTPQ